MAPCESNDQCQIGETCQLEAEGTLLAAFQDHCFGNICSPNPEGMAALLVTTADSWFGACDAVGTADGLCMGPIDQNALTGPFGVCFNASGSLPAGSPCSPTAFHGATDEICDAGACIAGDDGTGTCLLPCTLGDDCAPLGDGTETTCTALPQTIAESDRGICAPAAG